MEDNSEVKLKSCKVDADRLVCHGTFRGRPIVGVFNHNREPINIMMSDKVWLPEDERAEAQEDFKKKVKEFDGTMY